MTVKGGWIPGVEILCPYYPTPESVTDLLTGETPLIYAIQQVGTCSIMPMNSARSIASISSVMTDDSD